MQYDNISIVSNQRTKQSYMSDLDILKNNSILNNLKFFHVSNPGLPPCSFEGVIQYDLMLVIRKIIKDKLVTIDVLNDNIQNIRFQHEKKNLIPLLKPNDIKLPGSAFQNMWLLIILPFVCCKIETLTSNNEYFNFILLMRKICLIIISFKISESQIVNLRHYTIYIITLYIIYTLYYKFYFLNFLKNVKDCFLTIH